MAFEIEKYIELGFISKRFVLLIFLIAAGITYPETVTKDMIMMGIAFYFASHVQSDKSEDVPVEPVVPEVIPVVAEHTPVLTT